MDDALRDEVNRILWGFVSVWYSYLFGVLDTKDFCLLFATEPKARS